MRVLVTGAGGYIGSRVFHDLLTMGHDPIGIDNFSNAQVREIEGERIHNVDISSKKDLKEFFPVERVIHLAAISGVMDCEHNKDEAYFTNVIGTANLAYLCDNYDVPLLFASSMAIFGEPRIPVREGNPRNPLNFYGKTKLLGTELVKLFRNKGYIFIMSNVYGTHTINGGVITKQTIINKFVQNVKDGNPIEIYKPGTQARNFIHVEDLSKAYCTAIDKIDGLTEMCLATNDSLSVNEIVSLVKRHAKNNGYDLKTQYVENPRTETLVKSFEVDLSQMNEMDIFPTHTVEDEIKMLFQE